MILIPKAIDVNTEEQLVHQSKINGIHANAFSENGVPVGEKVILKLVPVVFL